MAIQPTGFYANFTGIATRKEFNDTVLEDIKEVELTNNDVSVFIPELVSDLKTKNANKVSTVIARIIIRHHPEKIDEVVEVLESLLGDKGWRNIKVFGDGSTLGDIDDEINFTKFALKPNVRDMAFERLAENPMTLIKILEYAKKNRELKKIINFYKEGIPDNYAQIVEQFAGELDTTFIGLLKSLDSGEIIKYKPTQQAKRAIPRLNESKFVELYKIIETVDGNNPLKRFMNDSISEVAKIKILRDILLQGEDSAKIRGQLADISAGTQVRPKRVAELRQVEGKKSPEIVSVKETDEKTSWKRFYGKLSPRDYVVNNFPFTDMTEEEKEVEIDRRINQIKSKTDNPIKDGYLESKKESVDITYGDIKRKTDLRAFISEIVEYDETFFGSGEINRISEAKAPAYPLITILLLNPPIQKPADYKFVDSSVGTIDMGKVVLENMLFIFDKFNMNITTEFKEFSKYSINRDFKKLNELLDDGVNFKQIEEQLKNFIDEKASSIIEVILNNILDLLGNMNSRLTYYKPSLKAFTEAGRSRRVEAGEIDTDTAIEYLQLIGLIQER